jgi:hypothetical protein
MMDNHSNALESSDIFMDTVMRRILLILLFINFFAIGHARIIWTGDLIRQRIADWLPYEYSMKQK